MVDRQLRGRGIMDERVLRVMSEVDREEFVPDEVRHLAYEDGAIPLGRGQTISQPWVVAAICQALELHGGERLLEVGTGSGYSTAILSRLVQPGGAVQSTEIVDELAQAARATLARLGYVATVETTDGSRPGRGEWERIAVHAAAPEFPAELADALHDGGVMVIPLKRGRSDMLTRVRRAGDEYLLDEIAECRFVPLITPRGR